MAIIGGTPSSPKSTVSLTGSTTPTIANVTMALAGTEYSYVLPANTKKFLIKLRDANELQLSYNSGDSGTLYVTVPRGNFYGEEDLSLSSTTIYFQSPVAGQTAEVISWT